MTRHDQWTPEQQRITPQERRAAPHPGNRKKSAICEAVHICLAWAVLMSRHGQFRGMRHDLRRL
jgi:hypothetical protein